MTILTPARLMTICPETTLVDSIATLQARATRADTLEQTLSQILNTLAPELQKVDTP